MVDRGNNLVLPVGPCSTELTESQASFAPPKIKKVLRKLRLQYSRTFLIRMVMQPLEQIAWNSFYGRNSLPNTTDRPPPKWIWVRIARSTTTSSARMCHRKTKRPRKFWSTSIHFTALLP